MAYSEPYLQILLLDGCWFPVEEILFVISVTQTRTFPAASRSNCLWGRLKLPVTAATFFVRAGMLAVGRCLRLAHFSSSVPSYLVHIWVDDAFTVGLRM